MKVIQTALPGVLIIEPDVFRDPRGFFMEVYHQQKFEELGIPYRFVQDNHSRSAGGTLRGLHYQLKFPQAKLCRVVVGEVLDVAVDIRCGSPTFGKCVTVILSAENQRQLLVPEGFAHGFVVRSAVAEFLYKCSDFYRSDDDRGIAWNDPEIGIPWEITEAPTLSARDTRNPCLANASPEQLPTYL